MLPRLEAEERLARINDGAVAAGIVDRDARREAIAALEESAGFEHQRPAKASADALQGMGIGVRAALVPSELAVSDG